MCRYHWDKYKCPFCQQSTTSTPTIRHKSDICRYAKRRHLRHPCRTVRAGGTKDEARHVTYKPSPDRTVLLATGRPCGSARCKELVREAQWQKMVRGWWAGQAKREGRTGVEKWREDVAVKETMRAWEKGQAERRRKAGVERWRMGCETISEEEVLGLREGGHGVAGAASGSGGEGHEYHQGSSSSQRGPQGGGVYTPLRAPTRAPSNASVLSASSLPVRSAAAAAPSSVASSSGHSSSHRSASGSVFSRSSAPSSVSSTASYATSRTRGSGSGSLFGSARYGRTQQKSSSASSRSCVASPATKSNQSTSKALVLWNRGQTRPAGAAVSTPTATATSKRIPFPTNLFPRRRPVPSPNTSSSATGSTPLTSQALVIYNKSHSPPGSVATSAAATILTSASRASQTSQTYPPSSRRTYTSHCRRGVATFTNNKTSSTATNFRVHPPQSISSSSFSMVSSNPGENYLDRSNYGQRYVGSGSSTGAKSYRSVSPISRSSVLDRGRRQQRRYGGGSTTAGSEDARSYRSVSPMSSISNRPEGHAEGEARPPLKSGRGMGMVNPLRRLLGLRDSKVRTR